MRFFEFSTKLTESLPSIVDNVHAALNANSNQAGSANITATSPQPTTSQGSINTGISSTGSTPSTLGVSNQTNSTTTNSAGVNNTNSPNTVDKNGNTPNLVAGASLKLKTGNTIKTYKISKVDPTTKQVTLANDETQDGAAPQGQPASATYNINDLMNNIV